MRLSRDSVTDDEKAFRNKDRCLAAQMRDFKGKGGGRDESHGGLLDQSMQHQSWLDLSQVCPLLTLPHCRLAPGHNYV